MARCEGDPSAQSAEPEEASKVEARAKPLQRLEDQQLLTGKTVGSYKLLVPIGAGGMAQVWGAAPSSGGIARKVAIKLVLSEYSSDPEYERLFVDEAMVASAVRHPNVCGIHRLGRDGDCLFMILELVIGDSLTGLIQRGSEFRPLPDAVAVRIVADACGGLHAAHEAVDHDGRPLGIVHRDVSPPNVLVSTQGHVKVSDFGIAKASYQLHTRTKTGDIKGKIAYIPPEQILGRRVDRRADIYALGCVLYVATLGMRPFGSGTAALSKIVKGTHYKPSQVRKGYPDNLEAIIERALSREPEARYQTAEEMRLALERWLVSEGQVVLDSDVAKIVNERLTPDRRAVIEALKSSSTTLPPTLARKLLAQSDRSEVTANSQIIASIRPLPIASHADPRPAASAPAVDRSAKPTWRPPKRPATAMVPPLSIPASPKTGFDSGEPATGVRRQRTSSSPPTGDSRR